MSLPNWLLKLFCWHPHVIMRWREKRMGFECTFCFHWRPIQPNDCKDAVMTPVKSDYRKVARF